MNVQIEMWHLVTLGLTVLGGYWTLAKVVAGQAQRHLDDRFAAQDATREAHHKSLAGRLDGIELVNREEAAQWQRVERDLLKMQAEIQLIKLTKREAFVQTYLDLMRQPQPVFFVSPLPADQL